MPMQLDTGAIKAESRSLLRTGEVNPFRMTLFYLLITLVLDMINSGVSYMIDSAGGFTDDDVFVEQRDKHRGDLIADEAELEQEKLHLIAICLPLAQVQCLHHAELGIFTQVQHGERVAVGRDDAGDDEKHRPQEDENALDDGEQDDLSGEGEGVEQAIIRHLLAAQNAEAVAKVARVQNERDKPDQNAHKAERKHREAACRLDGIAYALGVMEALDLSKRQTNGYKMQLFLLQLSFIGYQLAAALIAVLYEYAIIRFLPDSLPGVLLGTLIYSVLAAGRLDDCCLVRERNGHCRKDRALRAARHQDRVPTFVLSP